MDINELTQKLGENAAVIDTTDSVFEQLKRVIGENTLWIDTTGNGIVAAELLEAKGIKVNRFTRNNLSDLFKYLWYEQELDYRAFDNRRLG